MTDRAVENAKRKREELAERINRAQQELDECRPLLARVEQFLADYETFASGELPDDDSGSKATPVAKPSARRNSSKEEVAKHARILIEEAGKPIPKESLRPMLLARGLTIEGNDADGVMNTMLWRTRAEVGVIHLRNVGYWLREKEWSPAHYMPDLDEFMGVEDDAPAEGIEDSEAPDQPV